MRRGIAIQDEFNATEITVVKLPMCIESIFITGHGSTKLFNRVLHCSLRASQCVAAQVPVIDKIGGHRNKNHHFRRILNPHSLVKCLNTAVEMQNLRETCQLYLTLDSFMI